MSRTVWDSSCTTTLIISDNASERCKDSLRSLAILERESATDLHAIESVTHIVLMFCQSVTLEYAVSLSRSSFTLIIVVNNYIEFILRYNSLSLNLSESIRPSE